MHPSFLSDLKLKRYQASVTSFLPPDSNFHSKISYRELLLKVSVTTRPINFILYFTGHVFHENLNLPPFFMKTRSAITTKYMSNKPSTHLVFQCTKTKVCAWQNTAETLSLTHTHAASTKNIQLSGARTGPSLTLRVSGCVFVCRHRSVTLM